MDEANIGLKYDPQEDDPVLSLAIAAAGVIAREHVLGDRTEQKLGECHAIWAEQKKLLAEQGIDWKTPAELTKKQTQSL